MIFQTGHGFFYSRIEFRQYASSSCLLPNTPGLFIPHIFLYNICFHVEDLFSVPFDKHHLYMYFSLILFVFDPTLYSKDMEPVS